MVRTLTQTFALVSLTTQIVQNGEMKLEMRMFTIKVCDSIEKYIINEFR